MKTFLVLLALCAATPAWSHSCGHYGVVPTGRYWTIGGSEIPPSWVWRERRHAEWWAAYLNTLQCP